MGFMSTVWKSLSWSFGITKIRHDALFTRYYRGVEYTLIRKIDTAKKLPTGEDKKAYYWVDGDSQIFGHEYSTAAMADVHFGETSSL